MCFKKKIDVGVFGDLVPSPDDPRDLLSSDIMPEIKRYPVEYPMPFDLTVLDQGSDPCCVGCAGASIKQFLEMKEGHFILPDFLWLYNECKKIDGLPSHVKGTYFRAVLQVLRNKGCKLQGVDNDPSLYRIKEYRRVNDMSFEGLKKHIAVFGHTLAGWRMSAAGWRGEVIRAPKAYEKTGGHATFNGHYFKDYGGGMNSWGVNRHKGGFFKFPPTYLPFEAWVVPLDDTNEAKKAIPTGWVAAMYVIGGKTLYNLNVRVSPGLNSKRIKVLPKGTEVKEYGTPKIVADGYTWMEIIL